MPLKILILDDKPDVANTISESIKQNGRDIYISTSYQEAISHIRQKHEFDWIICDINLNNSFTGIDFAKLYTKSFPYSRVIIFSGYPSLVNSVISDIRKIPNLHGLFYKPDLKFSKIEELLSGRVDTIFPTINEDISNPLLKTFIRDMKNQVNNHEESLKSLKMSFNFIQDQFEIFEQDQKIIKTKILSTINKFSKHPKRIMLVNICTVIAALALICTFFQIIVDSRIDQLLKVLIPLIVKGTP